MIKNVFEIYAERVFVSHNFILRHFSSCFKVRAKKINMVMIVFSTDTEYLCDMEHTGEYQIPAFGRVADYPAPYVGENYRAALEVEPIEPINDLPDWRGLSECADAPAMFSTAIEELRIALGD